MDPVFLRKYFTLLLKPDDEGASNDGSLFDAVSAMPDIEALEKGGQPNGNAPPMDDPGVKAARNREENGRFKAKEKDDSQEAEKAPADDEKSKENTGAEDDSQDDEDDYFEIAAEKDGEAPQRLKVSDVYAGYQKASTLEKELADIKAKGGVLPADAIKSTEDLITQMSAYEKAVQQFAAMQTPVDPDIEMLNEASEKYNPSLYYQQKANADKARKALEASNAELQRVAKERQAHEARINQARFQREQAKLNEFWPELISDKDVQSKVLAEAEKHFGITAEEFNGFTDHRHYKVLKDALAYRAAQAKTEAAVKVVRAKPKLVKGAARSSVNQKDARRADAMSRLRDSGSLEDAADALDGFLH